MPSSALDQAQRFLPPPRDPITADKWAPLLQQGIALTNAARFEEAEPLLRQALALAPDNVDALLGMANFHERRGTDPAAEMDFAFRALRSQPNHPAANKLMALALRACGLEPLAVGHLRKCLELNPRDANAAFHLGLTLLQFGHWEEGWRIYENRPTTATANGYAKPAPPGTTEWRGQDLRGKAILLLGEDGHGDQIQNLRFARDILSLAPRRLILDVRPSLRRLFLHALNHLPGGDVVSVATERDAGPAIDYVLAFGSMGGRFGANGASLSKYVPYLRPAVAPNPRPPIPARIGIAWRGNPLLVSDRVRSIALSEFIPLFEMSGRVQWVGLQHDDHRPEELLILKKYGVETPDRSYFDLLDTAGFIADLDLVVAVDTSIVHLAGGIGKPVWLLLRATGEWRWGWKASTSPWYPTARIFHQERLTDWAPVIRDVRQTLAALV